MGYWLMDIGYFCKQHTTITAQRNNKAFFNYVLAPFLKCYRIYTGGFTPGYNYFAAMRLFVWINQSNTAKYARRGCKQAPILPLKGGVVEDRNSVNDSFVTE